ncbi:MAG: hypothetical protein ACI8Q1_001864 [Parvicella sp.]|jgi:hypothetical protein
MSTNRNETMKKIMSFLLLGALISSCTVQMEDEEIHELLFGYNRGLVAGVQIGDSWEDIKKNVRPGWTIRN